MVDGELVERFLKDPKSEGNEVEETGLKMIMGDADADADGAVARFLNTEFSSSEIGVGICYKIGSAFVGWYRTGAAVGAAKENAENANTVQAILLARVDIVKILKSVIVLR